jgi:hypothetical protein
MQEQFRTSFYTFLAYLAGKAVLSNQFTAQPIVGNILVTYQLLCGKSVHCCAFRKQLNLTAFISGKST